MRFPRIPASFSFITFLPDLRQLRIHTAEMWYINPNAEIGFQEGFPPLEELDLAISYDLLRGLLLSFLSSHVNKLKSENFEWLQGEYFGESRDILALLEVSSIR